MTGTVRAEPAQRQAAERTASGQLRPRPGSSAPGPQALLALQRAAGNRAVAAAVQRGAAPAAQVQRQAVPAAPPAVTSAPSVGTAANHKFKFPMGDIRLDWRLGPVRVPKVSGEIEVEAKSDAGAASERPTQVTAGTTSQGLSQGGVQAEVSTQVLDRYRPLLQGAQPVFKTGGELTTAGGELGFELGIENARVEPAVRFSLVRYETTPTERELTFATLEAGAAFPSPEFPVTVAGRPFKVKAKFAVKFLVRPDWPAIGRYLAERFGRQAVVELGAAGGFLLAGVATIAAAFTNMGLGREIAGRAGQVQRDLRVFCRSYASVLSGGEALGGTHGEAGAAAARRRLETATVPRSAMVAEAQRRDLYEEAWETAFPEFRRRAVAAYWEEHWFEARVYGRGDRDGPGIRTFTRVLDAMSH